MLNSDYIQEWPLEAQQELLNAVLAVTQEPLDICAVGSRVWGAPQENSDIDMVVYTTEDAPKRLNYHSRYEEVGLNIKFRPISHLDAPLILYGTSYHLSSYSLMTGTLYPGDEAQEQQFLTDRENGVI